MNSTKTLSVLAAIAAILGMASSAQAILLTTSSPQYVGYIYDGIPSSGDDEASYINILIAQPVGSGPTTVGTETYTRSDNDFGPLPNAVGDNGVKDESQSNTGSFGDGGYDYLVAKYDGPNFGEVVWYVAGLTGDFELPTGMGGRNNTQYGISHFTLFKGQGVPGPDGGTTAMLLGLAMLGLGGLKRLVRG